MDEFPGSLTEEYRGFLAAKAPRAQASGIAATPMRSALFDFQRLGVEFALRQGRAAVFFDTGLGKGLIELEFATQAAAASNGCSLILTPLSVARQLEREAVKFGYENVRVVRDASEVRPGINICNYDRLDQLEPSAFGCVVLDESSVLKSFAGKTTRALIEAFAHTPFRLAATATPAPNDHLELGTHAEFLGVMARSEMLIRWFLNDSGDTKTWRLKGHATQHFWDWVSSWAIMAERPEDLGCDGSRFELPPLNVIRHRVQADIKPMAGELFARDVSAIGIHALKRQTADARAARVADILGSTAQRGWIIWCDTDYEQDAVARMLPGTLDVRGSLAADRKEQAVLDFIDGRSPVLLSKPSIFGYGMNFQHCAQQIFVGRSFSYETWYQAVRRSWRFGQTRPVDIHLMVAEGEDQIGRVIDRKAEDHIHMKQAMRAATARAMSRGAQVRVRYVPSHIGRMPSWLV